MHMTLDTLKSGIENTQRLPRVHPFFYVANIGLKACWMLIKAESCENTGRRSSYVNLVANHRLEA
jgi:hypothetical protein